MESVSIEWLPESEPLAATVAGGATAVGRTKAADLRPKGPGIGFLGIHSTLLFEPSHSTTLHSHDFPELPGFVIHDQIGQGGMGVVYRATQTSLNRTVALKILPKELAAKKRFVTRFYEETKVLSTLTHPNIVTIIDRGNVGDTYYFVMEYVVGKPLSSKLGAPLPTLRLLQIAEAICEGLKYAHEKQLVHRDIKPANIMLTNTGATKVMDFGLAGVVSTPDRASAARSFMGTPGYMSPEQMVNAECVDGRSDVYSLGVVLHEMAVGNRGGVEDRTPVSEISPRVDPRLDPIILRCLKADVEERYRSVAELLEDLHALRKELEDEPACPSCGYVNPVRAGQCEGCGRELADHFDICTDCGGENRVDVSRCFHCGADLKMRREEILCDVEQIFQTALQQTYAQDYYEAQQALKEVLAMKGRFLQRARTRAVTMLKKLDFGPQRHVKQRFHQGRLLLDGGHLEGAIATWRSIKPAGEEVETAIKCATLNLATTYALRRAKRKMLAFAAGLGLSLIALLVTVVLLAAG